MGSLTRFLCYLALVSVSLLAQEKIVKYYAAGENPASVFGNEIALEDTNRIAYFRVTFSTTGEIISIKYVKPSVITGTDTIVTAEPDTVNYPVFIPLTAEQQAALNPRNPIIQNAWFWHRSSFGINEDLSPESPAVDTATVAALDTTESDTAGQDTVPKPLPEVIAIFEANAPEPDSVRIKERKEQQILKSRKKRVGYYKKWNVFKSAFSDPLTPKTAISNYYEAHFDKNGTLERVVQYRIRGKPVKTYTFQRDSTGLYLRFTVMYHIRESILSENPHKYAYPASELRPGWQARYQMDPSQKRIAAVSVFDEHGIPMYRYEFNYLRGRDMGKPEFRTVTISRYFTQSDSLVGFHYLWYGKDRDLVRIEYFQPDSTLKQIKEFYFIPDRKELMITLRDGTGKLLARRLKPVF